MVAKITYQLLESLMPPSVGDDIYNRNLLLRLESISACSIINNGILFGNLCQNLSKTPAHLHSIIWKAYLRNEYYCHYYNCYQDNKNDWYEYYNNTNILEKAIPELLYHWPYEEFILKDIMPKLPPRLDSFSSFWKVDNYYDLSYQNTQPYLLGFFNNVSCTIAKTFCICVMDDYPNHNKQMTKIRQINMSGFYHFELDTISDMAEKVIYYKPFFKNSLGNIEVILDVKLLSVPISDFERFLDKLDCNYSNSSSPVILKFSHVSVRVDTSNHKIGDSFHQTKSLTRLIERLVNNGTSSIGLYELTDIDESNILENVFEKITKKENIQSINYSVSTATSTGCRMATLDFVLYLKNLVHLDLSSSNLHGKLEILSQMHRGLLFLKLQNCHLTNGDLAQFKESCHMSTLMELNLRYNDLSYDESGNNLIMLSKNLTNVQQLDLGVCNLASWHSNEIQSLIHSFKILPNIVHLQLCNRFSINTVTVDIMVLMENPSLRFLELLLPTQITEGHENNHDNLIKSFCSRMNAKMNNGRSQLLYVYFIK